MVAILRGRVLFKKFDLKGGACSRGSYTRGPIQGFTVQTQ